MKLSSTFLDLVAEEYKVVYKQFRKLAKEWDSVSELEAKLRDLLPSNLVDYVISLYDGSSDED